jgi:hypothetical protein
MHTFLSLGVILATLVSIPKHKSAYEHDTASETNPT